MKRLLFLVPAISLHTASCRSISSGESRSLGSPEETPSQEQKDGGAEPGRIDLNSTISLLGVWDYQIKKDGTSRCLAMVDRATDQPHFNRMLHFIPTYYFLADPEPPKKEAMVAESSTDQSSTHKLVYARKFCVLTDEKNCQPLNLKTVKELREGLTKCFARAVERGAGIAVTPHLDDGKRRGQWRNTVIFDPFPHLDRLCKKGTFDYYCGFLKPIAEALRTARKPDTPVYMSTQGEMGATVFAYPGRHGQLVHVLREIIAGIPPEEGREDLPSPVRTGVNLNFNEAFGMIPANRIDRKGVEYLLSGSTYLGISAYAPLKRDAGKIGLWRFDTNFEMLNQELGRIGINLRWFKNLELHLSEVGLGGSSDGAVPAESDEEALNTPFYGIHGDYASSHDPWRSPLLRQTRFDYHCTLINYLAKPSRQSWPIKHAFLWNLTSWDVQGIYPSSQSPQGTYADPGISWMIAHYNRTGTHSCPWYEAREKSPSREPAPLPL